jgi:hypothetical protein
LKFTSPTSLFTLENGNRIEGGQSDRKKQNTRTEEDHGGVKSKQTQTQTKTKTQTQTKTKTQTQTQTQTQTPITPLKHKQKFSSFMLKRKLKVRRSPKSQKRAAKVMNPVLWRNYMHQSGNLKILSPSKRPVLSTEEKATEEDKELAKRAVTIARLEREAIKRAKKKKNLFV